MVVSDKGEPTKEKGVTEKNSQEHLLTVPIQFVKILPAVLEATKKKQQRFAKANLCNPPRMLARS